MRPDPSLTTLPLFPGTFKRLDSRPDGKPPAFLVWVYRCAVCKRVWWSGRYKLMCRHAMPCPHCNRSSEYRPIVE
jgi:hypothetical protein